MDPDDIKRVPLRDLKTEEGADELVDSAIMQPYVPKADRRTSETSLRKSWKNSVGVSILLLLCACERPPIPAIAVGRPITSPSLETFLETSLGAFLGEACASNEIAGEEVLRMLQ